jgi:hypothetical protein
VAVIDIPRVSVGASLGEAARVGEMEAEVVAPVLTGPQRREVESADEQYED